MRKSNARSNARGKATSRKTNVGKVNVKIEEIRDKVRDKITSENGLNMSIKEFAESDLPEKWGIDSKAKTIQSQLSSGTISYPLIAALAENLGLGKLDREWEVKHDVKYTFIESKEGKVIDKPSSKKRAQKTPEKASEKETSNRRKTVASTTSKSGRRSPIKRAQKTTNKTAEKPTVSKARKTVGSTTRRRSTKSNE